METKTFELEIKELSEEGKFSGYLSTFGNVDAGGDAVEPGAFKKTLKDKKMFPFLWQHQGTPDSIVGSFSGKEDHTGLWIEGGFFTDLDAGVRSYKLAKTLIGKGIKVGLSMGYKAIKFEFDKIKEITVRRLKEVALYEGSLTLWPMNDEASLVTVKEMEEFDYEKKPYPNEHACRLHDPGGYERFARMTRKHNGKEYSVIIGFKKGGGSEDQAYRYPKDTWSASEARSHCKDHDGSFEAASGKSFTLVCKSCGETLTITEPVDATQPKAEPITPEAEPANLYSVLKETAGKLKSI